MKSKERRLKEQTEAVSTLWATVSEFNSRCRIFISVCNQPATQSQLPSSSIPSGSV